MFAKNGSQTISGNFDDNYAQDGGSIYVIGSSLAIKDSCFVNNQAGKNGGVLYVNNDNSIERNRHIIGSLEIQNSSIVKNRAAYNGGVLYLIGFFINNLQYHVQINQSNFFFNSARTGGVLYSEGKNIFLTETKNRFIANEAFYIGAIMYIMNNQLLHSRNAHIENNNLTKAGVVVLYQTNAYYSGTTTFYKNNGTSSIVIGSRMSFTGKVNFTANVRLSNASNTLYTSIKNNYKKLKRK